MEAKRISENQLEDKNQEGGREPLQVKHWWRSHRQYDATHVFGNVHYVEYISNSLSSAKFGIFNDMDNFVT